MANVMPSGNGSGVFVPANAAPEMSIADLLLRTVGQTSVQPDTYAADAQRSETMRQADQAAARKKFGFAAPMAFEAQSDIDAFKADMKAADVNHLCRIYAAAKANGRDLGGYAKSLQDLGVSV